MTLKRYSWILEPAKEGEGKGDCTKQSEGGKEVENGEKGGKEGESEAKLIATLKDGVTSLAWEHSPDPLLLAAGSIGNIFLFFFFFACV